MDLAQRPGVIHLEIGQPDFPTPAHIVAAANHAAERGHIGYTANAGLPELCEALAAKLHQDNGIRVSSEQIIVTIGAMGALYGSLLSVLEPGDQLLVPDPGYPNYRMTAELCGAEWVPYPLPATDGYQPDLEALAAAISPRTKAIVVGSPSNPTGTVIHRDRLQGIVELAERHDLYLVSDECYEKIVFDGRHVSPASLGAADRCFTAGSFSKSYAMTGWRVGYVACPKPIVPLLVKLQETTVSCAPVLSQHAALAALAGPQETASPAWSSAYRERRDLACELLMSAGLCSFRPEGAFYVLADLPGQVADTYAYARLLVEEADVAVAPGETFGAGGKGRVRISLTNGNTQLRDGPAAHPSHRRLKRRRHSSQQRNPVLKVILEPVSAQPIPAHTTASRPVRIEGRRLHKRVNASSMTH